MRDTVECIMRASEIAKVLKDNYSKEQLAKFAEDWINGDDDEFFEMVEYACGNFMNFVDAVAYNFYQ